MSLAPQAKLTIGTTEYTLQFSRDAVRTLEAMNMAPTTEGREGTPMALATTMFTAALKMHHPDIQPKRVAGLFDKALDEGYGFEDIFKTLMDLYNAVFSPPSREEGTESKKLVVLGLDTTEEIEPTKD